jgi:L-ribulose-5-phosphate 3-epimerase
VKKSISYWAFPGGLEGKKCIRECFVEAKAAGFEAVELAMGMEGEITLESSEDDIKEIVKTAEDVGIGISSLATGLYWDYNFASSDPSKIEMAHRITVKMLEIAKQLGVDTILVIPGSVDVFFDPSAEVIPYDFVWQRVTDALKALAPVAEDLRVNIGIENVWNKFLLSPIEMKYFIDNIGSEYVGVYFDVGNVMPFGYPEQWIRILGKRIKKVHFKDFKRACGTGDGFCDLLEGDVNWPAVMDAFREIGYDDVVTAEMIPLYAHYPEVRIQNTSFVMDKILGR